MLLALTPPAQAQRVVSLNLCADDYLLTLAPERAAAVTFLARDPAISVVTKEAAAIPTVRADAEAVLARHPDLILAGPYGAQTTLAVLAHHGLRIERVTLPDSFPDIATETLRLAAMLGVPARGAALVADMQRRLAAVRPAEHPQALALQPRGWTSGPGSLTQAVLLAAGMQPIGSGRQLGLEAIVTERPDVLVTASDPAFPSLATDLLRHPALAGIPRRTVPPALLICGGPWTVAAVEALAH